MVLARPRVESATGWVAARVFLVCAAALGVATAATLLDGRRAMGALGACALACLAVGLVLYRRWSAPGMLRPAATHAAVFVGWLLLIAIGTGTYLVTGTFGRFTDALFESTAGFTTSALSVLDPVEGTPKGILLWRASTQWLGGFAAVMVVIAFLPLLGVGGIEADSTGSERGARLRSPHLAATTRRLARAYVLLSLTGVALFLVAGLGPFDAVTYAMTTISSGGFGNHDASIAYFESALVEWCTIGGMVLAGANLVMILSAFRGRLVRVWHSTEVRAYLGVMLLLSLTLIWWTAPRGGVTAESARHAVFAVTSAMSTTGHTVGGWARWDFGPLVLLMLVAGVGAMSGAPGGGFRVIRALTLLGVVRREIVRQLHPHSVAVVKVGRASIEERVVSNMIGYQVAWVLLAGAGAIALGVAGLGFTEAVTGAVSALATYGPALGDLQAGTAAMSDTVLLVLLPLMLAGRLEISPVVVGATTVLRGGIGSRRGRRRP
jgi:trk system potassium uptake protein TrkH